MKEILDLSIGDEDGYHSGDMIIRYCAESSDEAFEMELILLGSCQSREEHRRLGYDTAHDNYHLDNYGLCHKHECGTITAYPEHRYLIVLRTFLNEAHALIINNGAQIKQTPSQLYDDLAIG
ncbi:hypothetical protein AAE485_04255 [Acidithiobacillus ferriphilus]|uniref:hypothetical protein n=1 Tax=Acidithiobacillus ferriphilus TaxID=1689834 RepID=UPI00390CC0F2